MRPRFTRSEYKSAVLHIASVVTITNSYGLTTLKRVVVHFLRQGGFTYDECARIVGCNTSNAGVSEFKIRQEPERCEELIEFFNEKLDNYW